MTHSSICVTWLTHIYDMTHSYVWHDSFIHMCDMTHSYIWHDALMCLTWLIHPYVWHDSFIYMTWRTHMCDVTYAYVGPDSLHMCDMTHSSICVWKSPSNLGTIYVRKHKIICRLFQQRYFQVPSNKDPCKYRAFMQKKPVETQPI